MGSDITIQAAKNAQKDSWKFRGALVPGPEQSMSIAFQSESQILMLRPERSSPPSRYWDLGGEEKSRAGRHVL